MSDPFNNKLWPRKSPSSNDGPDTFEKMDEAMAIVF